jgi:hypothetical protein
MLRRCADRKLKGTSRSLLVPFSEPHVTHWSSYSRSKLKQLAPFDYDLRMDTRAEHVSFGLRDDVACGLARVPK